MRDVLFINPPSVSEQPYFPIGLTYLNTILRQENIDSALLDLDALVRKRGRYNPENLEFIIRQAPAKVYGVTAMSVTWPWAAEIIQAIRAIFPKATITAGGPVFTLLAKHILELTPELDYPCTGEWELLITKFVRDLLEGKKPEDSPSLCYRDKRGAVQVNEPGPQLVDLDLLPLPFVPVDDYKGIEVLNVEVGRGCPFSCAFCSVAAIHGRIPRHKSPERVLSEIQYFFEHFGSRGKIISLEHDDLLSNNAFLGHFSELKLASRQKFRYALSTRLTHLNARTIADLERSGCIHIFMGLESGSERIQRLYTKHICRDNVLHVIESLTRAKIAVTCNFIIGFPEENENDLAETFAMMGELSSLGANLSVSYFCPEPGSKAGDSSSLADWMLVPDSPIYTVLAESGFRPGELDKRLHAFLYTVVNSHFDVLEEYSKAISYTTRLNDDNNC